MPYKDPAINFLACPQGTLAAVSVCLVSRWGKKNPRLPGPYAHTCIQPRWQQVLQGGGQTALCVPPWAGPAGRWPRCGRSQAAPAAVAGTSYTPLCVQIVCFSAHRVPASTYFHTPHAP